MRHITPYILIAATLALSACSADSDQSSPINSDENSSNSHDSNASSSEEAKDVIGTWEQKIGEGDHTSTFTASVTEEVITVEWDYSSDNDEPLWIGTFDAAKAAKGETVASKKDAGGVGPVSDRLMPDSLDFKLEDDQLKFTFNTDSARLDVALKKISDEPETKNELQNTDATRSFKDDVLELPTATVKITGHHVIDPGSPGNRIGDKPIIVFDYEMTNKTDKELRTADFSSMFTAIQDNDENSVNELKTGFSEYIDTDNMLDKIKKGGTVKSSAAFELDDLTTPVELVAREKYGEEEVGSQTYKLEESTPMDPAPTDEDSSPELPKKKRQRYSFRLVPQWMRPSSFPMPRTQFSLGSFPPSSADLSALQSFPPGSIQPLALR
ncbi:hypothetical protein CBI45_00170 [Corynebacterium kefirresidentii]|nr:hypothetical protein CBI45_00170 [Corynebacterium kefirresidentii]